MEFSFSRSILTTTMCHSCTFDLQPERVTVFVLRYSTYLVSSVRWMPSASYLSTSSLWALASEFSYSCKHPDTHRCKSRSVYEFIFMCFLGIINTRVSETAWHLCFLSGLHGDIEVFDLCLHALFALLQFHFQPGQVLQLLSQLCHRVRVLLPQRRRRGL